jgi:hypothetical protein
LGLAILLGAFCVPAAAEDAFDACDVFTAKDAEGALGTSVVETSSFKGKRPKVVMNCQYAGMKDGRAFTAGAQFRFAKNEAEMRQAFGDARLELQTKPLMIDGNDAFWSAKTGQLYVRKGRASLTIAVGPAKVVERDPEAARKLAEALVKKL